MVAGRVLRMPDGTTSILGQGRAECVSLSLAQKPALPARPVQPLAEPEQVTLGTEALMRAVLSLFEKAVQLSRTLPEDAYVAAMNLREPGPLADLIGSLLDPGAERAPGAARNARSGDTPAAAQHSSGQRARRTGAGDSHPRTSFRKKSIVRSGEFFLREQMRAIQSRAGEVDVQVAGSARDRGKDRSGRHA